MANETLLALAKKNLKKTDDQKAVEALTEQVEANENDFRNSLFEANKAAKSAKKRVAALQSDPTATADVMIAASRDLKVSEKNVEDITAIISVRF